MLSRRLLLQGATASAGVSLLSCCAATTRDRDGSRLTARPTRDADLSSRVAASSDPQPLGVEPGPHDALLYVPTRLESRAPEWFILCLHGAGASAVRGLSPLMELADRAGMVLLAPSSRAATWDAIGGSYGPDVAAIDRALRVAFGRTGARPRRVAVAGFSDGASYAVGLGLANGDLFSRVIAFSPGFVPVAPRVGRPAVFISHGTGDAVLPIARTSRRIVPALQDDGYDVTYHEFDGGHAVPATVARAAQGWLGQD